MASLILGVHHVQITIPVGAEAQARQFYCTLLGLVETPKPDNLKNRGGFWLQLSDIQLHIGTEDDFDRSQTKAHLAYRVANLGKIRAALTGAGIEGMDGLPIPGYARFECRDPFGNRLEFIQRV